MLSRGEVSFPVFLSFSVQISDKSFSPSFSVKKASRIIFSCHFHGKLDSGALFCLFFHENELPNYFFISFSAKKASQIIFLRHFHGKKDAWLIFGLYFHENELLKYFFTPFSGKTANIFKNLSFRSVARNLFKVPQTVMIIFLTFLPTTVFKLMKRACQSLFYSVWENLPHIWYILTF